jgi:hypothetical protein
MGEGQGGDSVRRKEESNGGGSLVGRSRKILGLACDSSAALIPELS